MFGIHEIHEMIIIVAVFFWGASLTMYLKEKRKNVQLTALYKMEQELATIDHLTGLYNRRELDQRLNEEIGRAMRYGHNLQVMFIDLDNFKGVNDTCGHTKGDDVLKKIASGLKQTVRRHDTLARYGGDEFVLILPEIMVESAKNVAEKIIGMIENIEIDGSIKISANVGIRRFNPKNPNADLIKGADSAMYIAKNRGKGKIHIHEH